LKWIEVEALNAGVVVVVGGRSCGAVSAIRGRSVDLFIQRFTLNLQ